MTALVTHVVPVDGDVHVLEYSGEMVPHTTIADVTRLFLSAGHDEVSFTTRDDGRPPRLHAFQVVGSAPGSPKGGTFVETVLAPTEALRWWHLYEIDQTL